MNSVRSQEPLACLAADSVVAASEAQGKPWIRQAAVLLF